jgi:hypothetical protein
MPEVKINLLYQSEERLPFKCSKSGRLREYFSKMPEIAANGE